MGEGTNQKKKPTQKTKKYPFKGSSGCSDSKEKVFILNHTQYLLVVFFKFLVLSSLKVLMLISCIAFDVCSHQTKGTGFSLTTCQASQISNF